MLKRSLTYALTACLVLVTGAYLVERFWHEQALEKELKGMGFLPINPPSTLMSIGSLYFVDGDLRNIRTVCVADPELVKNYVRISPSTKLVADQLQKGTYAFDLTIKPKSVLQGGADASDEFSRTVKFTLSDVRLYEIDLRNSSFLHSKMMEDKFCDSAVHQNIHSGYVCQGQSILHASGEFEMMTTTADQAKIQGKMDEGEFRQALKEAVQAKAETQVTEREGRLQTGSSLHYGVAMNPTCLAPRDALFGRSLPKNALDQAVNFVKFRIIEPVFARRAEAAG